MQVGQHEAIHDVGFKPSTMNSGARTACALFGAFGGLCNSGCHKNRSGPDEGAFIELTGACSKKSVHLLHAMALTCPRAS